MQIGNVMNRFRPILLAVLLPAVAHAAPAGMMNLRVTGTEEQRRAVETLTDAGMELLAVTLHESAQPSSRVISIRFSPTPAPVADTPLAVELAENPSLYETTHRLMQALLLRRALDLRPEDTLLPPGNTGWLAAALTNRLLHNGLQARLNPVPDVTLFPPDGKMPVTKALVDNPLPPEQSALYILYARRCDALLAVLETKQGRDEARIRRIFELQALGQQAADAIQICMLDQFDVTDSFQSWVQHAADEYLRRLPHHLTCEEIQARLGTLPFPVEPPPVPAASSTAAAAEPLTDAVTFVIGPGRRDIPYHPQTTSPEPQPTPSASPPQATSAPPESETVQAKTVTPEDRSAIVRKLYDALLELYRDAPILLQPAIQAYILGVDAMKSSNQKRALQLFAKARLEFATCAIRQQQLNTYLNALDDENHEDALLRRQMRALASESRDRQRALVPDIHAFLDRQEAAQAAGIPAE